ncbi:ATPase with role in protein import into the ER, partial [Rhizoclosmatium sp. JEL0117]
QFEELNMDLFQETLVYVDKVLKDGGISKQEVNDVILVGGSTNIPKIVELIEQQFGRKLVLNGINPEQAVVYGTAIQGGVISGMFGNPEVLAFDLYPLSLGIETAGGIMTKIVERNTEIPLSKSQVFPLQVDEQGTAQICFFQGERALARNNNKLECIALEGVTKSLRGIANIEVGISIDINALVSLSAMDTESGKLRQINIDSLLNINEEQLERMIQEAEQKADEDQVLLENIEARIGFEDYLYSVMHEISNLELSVDEIKQRGQKERSEGKNVGIQ